MTITKTFSKKEVAEFNGKGGKPCWMIYRGGVYDFTTYLNKHPGGKKVMLEYAGKDCTKDFESMGHTKDALLDMVPYKIGEIREVKFILVKILNIFKNNLNSKDETQEKLTMTGSFVSIMSTDSERKKKRRFLLCR